MYHHWRYWSDGFSTYLAKEKRISEMIVDCVADLHGFYPELEGGDLLIVAGDLTAKGEAWEMRENFMPWIIRQNYRRKVFIAGNHDNALFETMPLDCPIDGINYLCDSGTEFEWESPVNFPFSPEDKTFFYRKKLKIWGSPWTKSFPGMNPRAMAFTVDTEEELAEKWAKIPEDIDILVTHGPSHGCLDELTDGTMCGSVILQDTIYKIKPKIHIAGHIHQAYGIYYSSKNTPFYPTIFVNASHVNERYEPVNKPIRVVL